MNETPNLTMKDIARELGVSIATVSRALKDSPRISAEKREEIKKYAREHKFLPNMIAKTLRRSKIQPPKIIGVIVPEFTHFYFSSILAGIEEEASARGYSLMIAQSNEKYEREVKICKSFHENKVCGIAIVAKQVENPCLLFGIEHLFAVHVAIVSAVSTKKLFDLISQRKIVFAFHFAEKRRKSPRNAYHTLFKIVFANISLQGRGVDGRATCCIHWHLFANKIAHTCCLQRAVLDETQGPIARHRPKIECGVRHNDLN